MLLGALALMVLPSTGYWTLETAGAASAWQGADRVTLVRTPDGGIQPQAVIDPSGTLHLIYFKGDPAAGDLFYRRQVSGSATLSEALRVNSQPGSAVAIGTIRGGQISLGKSGRVHVAWNGSGQAQPRGPGGGFPMLYSRLNDTGTGFEPQRNLMQFTTMLDGGGTVAADGRGNVTVAWHAGAGTIQGEEHRRLWVAHSRDEGKTFTREALAWPALTGACGCCGSRGFADSKGTWYLLYRSAAARVNRDMYLLTAGGPSEPFRGAMIDRWQVDT
jgi:hypothetical protein